MKTTCSNLKAFKPQSLQPPSASAGDAKRKQSARPSFRMSEGVLDPCPFPTNFPSISFPTTLRVSLRGLAPSPLFFRPFFSSSNFLSKCLFFGSPRDPKIDPKPPSGLKVGSPSRFFMHFLVVHVFFTFFTCILTIFRCFFDDFFDAFFDVFVCFFQTAEPSKSSPWTVF